MKVASHLMSRGYDVIFHDLEGGRGYDFLAAKEGVSVEVECKHMSGDAGRKIHRKELYRFGDRAALWMRNHLASLTTGLFVRLTIPDRLESGDQYQKALCTFLGQALLSGEPDAERDGNRIQVQEFDVEQVAGPWLAAGKFDRTEMEARLTHHFGLAHKNALLYLRPHQSVVALLIQSDQKDNVLNAMHAELRKSTKDQFTGELPAILCCHLADLTQEQMLSLGRGGHGRALDSLATELMRRRPHLYSVTFTAAGSVSADSVREKGPAYTILNRDHPRATDERLSIFRDGWP
ncbi:MAG: hypothetical protein OXG82_16275 [Gammaproteobacteria bacterium]|nr:hypothetical protein [Gammaproteobacteria bacterium]